MVRSKRDASGRRSVGGRFAAAAVAGVLLLPAVAARGEERQEGRSVSDGVYTAEQAGRGRREYIQHCATCHSTNLRGGEMAPGLVGDTFLGGWSGATLWELFDFSLATMPQDNPGSTSPEAMNAILAYVLRENGYDPGEEDLALDPAADGDPITID
ncbi:MAG: cytochrome c [Acidobacteria bacterium]|nr:cytochrome c [Acidobacteriota bacterium]